MSTRPDAVWYTPDSRANRLDRWTTTAYQGGHVLWLRGPGSAASQVRSVEPQYQEVAWAPPVGSDWTHALFSPEPAPSIKVRSVLELLTEILTLQRCPDLYFGLALDWYKIPDSTISSYDWLNTPNGDLVHRGKYWYKNDRDEQSKVGRQLAQNMVNVFNRHAALDRATVVLDVPGHDATRLSFGSRLAATIAAMQHKDMVKVRTRSQFRPEAKNLSGPDRSRIFQDEFYIADDIRGMHVVIIDDVFKSGTSLGAVAKAARNAGALTVAGFAAVRTLSS